MDKQIKIRKLRFTISFKFGLFIAIVLIFTAAVIGLFIVEQQKDALQANLKKSLSSYLPEYQRIVERIVKHAVVDIKDDKKRNSEKRQALKKLYNYTISLKANPNFYKADFVESAFRGRVLANSGWKSFNYPKKKMIGLEPYQIVDNKSSVKHKKDDYFIHDAVLPNEFNYFDVRVLGNDVYNAKKDVIIAKNMQIRAYNGDIERKNIVLRYLNKKLLVKKKLEKIPTDKYKESFLPVYVNYFKQINRYDRSLTKALALFKTMKQKEFLFQGQQSKDRLGDFKLIKELEKIYKRIYQEKVKDGRVVKVTLRKYGKKLLKRKKFKLSSSNLRFLARYVKYLRNYKEPKIRLLRGQLKAPYYVENPSRLFNKRFLIRTANFIENFYREKLTAKQKVLVKAAKAGNFFRGKLTEQDRFELYAAMTYQKVAEKFNDIVTGVKDEKRRKLFQELTKYSFIRPFQAGGDAMFMQLRLCSSYFQRYLDKGTFSLPKKHFYLRLGKHYFPSKSVKQRQEFFRHLFRMVVLPYRFGTVRIVLSAESIRKEVGAFTNKTTDLSASLVLRLIFFAFVLSGLMVKNIRNLAKGADQVGKGDLDTHIEIGSSDELGQLADRFNLMVSEIKDSQFQMIEKARMEEDLQTAHRIQESLLPSKFPEVDGFEFAGYYKAQTEAGGDYYDAIPPEMTGGDYFGLASADVSGHGVGAGLVMTMVRSVLRAQSVNNEDPGKVLSLSNPQIHGDTLPAMFATAVYFTVNFKNYTMQYASAGHDPAILYNVETKELRSLPAQGIPLGMSAKATFNSIIETKKDVIKKGDILILYTDGITEAMNIDKEEYEEERFCAAIKRFGHLPLQDLLEALVNDVKEFTNNLPQEDDISLLAMKVLK